MVMNQLKYFAPFRTLSISSSLQAIRIFKTTLNTSDPKSDVKMLLLSSLILSTFGLASLWAAVFADVGVTVIAVLNSLRALNVKNL